MFRLTVRDAAWLAVLSAVLIAWYFEYRDDALARHRDAQAIQYLKQQLSERPQPRILPILLPDGLPPVPGNASPGTGLRPVPGNWDYQFPPGLPKQLEPEPLIPWRSSP